MYKLIITSVLKETRVGNDEGVLTVIANIYDGDIEDGDILTSLQTVRREYPLGTSKDVIEEEMKKVLELFTNEQKKMSENMELNEKHKVADQVIQDLTSKQIKNEDESKANK